MEYLLGIDIGTSGCKSILIDSTGEVAGSTLKEYPLYTPHAGWSEQTPADWWTAVTWGIAELLKKTGVSAGDIKGMGLSGQMHGLVPLDRHDEVIRPAILWNDQRTTEQCGLILKKAGGLSGLLKLTNNQMLPGYTAGKLLWLRANEPENYEKMTHFLNPKDYIRMRLTGERATEVSDASGTGLFDVEHRTWSVKLLSLLDIPLSLLPSCHESTEVTGRITRKTAELTGLPEGLPVAGGGGDAVIQTTGMGLIRSGVLGTIIGTSGIVAMGLSGYHPNPEGLLQVFCNNTPYTWHVMGVTLNAGGAYRWFRDALGETEKKKAEETGEDVYTLMDRAAKGVPPGSQGLIFLPYLTGERCPYTDPAARGAFIGLGLHHGKPEITRSILEGVVFSLKDVYALIHSMDDSVTEIRTSGGGSLSPLWRQIQADVFQSPVITLSGSGEGGAYGAALVAGAGVGVWNSVDDAIGILKKETETIPNPDNKNIYEDMYNIYHSLYGALKPVYRDLNALGNG